jgi:hypothetical protein
MKNRRRGYSVYEENYSWIVIIKDRFIRLFVYNDLLTTIYIQKLKILPSVFAENLAWYK